MRNKQTLARNQISNLQASDFGEPKDTLSGAIGLITLALLLCSASSDVFAQINQDWLVTFGADSVDIQYLITGFTPDQQGNIVLAGSAGANELYSFFTVKFDSQGMELWRRYFKEGYDSRGSGLAVDPEGNIYVTGYGYKEDSTAAILTLKYDASGDLKWVSTFSAGPGSADRGVSVAVDSARCVYVSGTSAYGANKDIVTIKYSNTGRQGSYCQ